MRRVALQFSQAADIWNFLVVTGESAVRVEKHMVEGYFSPAEVELACRFFRATVYDHNRIDLLYGYPGLFNR